MSFFSMDVAVKKLKKWEFLFWASLLLSATVYLGYAAYVISYKPIQQKILLNQLGGVYSSEDLNMTNVSEGEVKQFAYKAIRKAFTYHYINFRQQPTYKKLLDGTESSSMPDHRDTLAPFFGKSARESLIDSLEKSPWSNRFYSQRRQVRPIFLSPPEKKTSDGFYKSNDGRLKVDYSGRFFINVVADGEKTNLFKIEYEVTLERKPLLIRKRDVGYYFAPMVPRNTFEWRVSEFTWKAKRSS